MEFPGWGREGCVEFQSVCGKLSAWKCIGVEGWVVCVSALRVV